MSGVKNKDFIVVADSKLEKRPVTFGKAGTAATMLCVCHSPKDDLCFTGSDTGLVYVWQGTTLYHSVQAHKGAVCAMYSLSQSKQQVWCFKLAHFDHSCQYSIPVPQFAARYWVPNFCHLSLFSPLFAIVRHYL